MSACRGAAQLQHCTLPYNKQEITHRLRGFPSRFYAYLEEHTYVVHNGNVVSFEGSRSRRNTSVDASLSAEPTFSMFRRAYTTRMVALSTKATCQPLHDSSVDPRQPNPQPSTMRKWQNNLCTRYFVRSPLKKKRYS